MPLIETAESKLFTSPNYNYLFDKTTGFFARWGKTKKDDPEGNPYFSELADIEVSTACHKACQHCYKSNTAHGKYMPLETFKKVFHVLYQGGGLTQIALGTGDVDGNPDLEKIMEYCRDNGVIPNITINGERMTPEYFKMLAKYCGAVAVSLYDDEDLCFDTVQLLYNYGVKQVYIHSLVASETFDKCIRVINSIPSPDTDWKGDERLINLKALVLLALKPKGKRNTFHPMTASQYDFMIRKLLAFKTPFGADSCSAHRLMQAIKKIDPKMLKMCEAVVEPCESSLFSIYCNVEGKALPCSFAEGEPGWEQGIDLTNGIDFDTMWNNFEMVIFRNRLLKNKIDGCRKCQLFQLD